MARSEEFLFGQHAAKYAKPDNPLGIQFRAVEGVNTAVQHTNEVNDEGLPTFWVADASDAGEYCGPACAERSMLTPQDPRDPPLRKMGEHSRILPSQLPDERDRSYLLQGDQFDMAASDDIVWEMSGGEAKNIVATRPLQPSWEENYFNTEDIAQYGQQKCYGPGCENALLPGGSAEDWTGRYSKSKPWLN